MDFVNENMDKIIWAAAILLILVVLLILWRMLAPSVMGRRGQRIGISEYHEVDKTRRLVLVRRDNVEHLILIGGNTDVVIESGITAAGVASAYVPQGLPADPGSVTPAAGAARPAPRPPVFGDRKPPPLRPVDPPLRRDDET